MRSMPARHLLQRAFGAAGRLVGAGGHFRHRRGQLFGQRGQLIGLIVQELRRGGEIAGSDERAGALLDGAGDGRLKLRQSLIQRADDAAQAPAHVAWNLLGQGGRLDEIALLDMLQRGDDGCLEISIGRPRRCPRVPRGGRTEIGRASAPDSGGA